MSETLMALRQFLADRERKKDKLEARAWEMFRISESRKHEKKLREETKDYQKQLSDLNSTKAIWTQLNRDEAVLEQNWAKSGIDLESLDDVASTGGGNKVLTSINEINKMTIEDQIVAIGDNIQRKEENLDIKKSFVADEIVKANAIIEGGMASVFPGGLEFGKNKKGYDYQDFGIEAYEAKFIDPLVAEGMAKYINEVSTEPVSTADVLRDYYNAYDPENVFKVGEDEISYTGDREGDLALKYGVDADKLKEVANQIRQSETGASTHLAIQDYFDAKAGDIEETMLARIEKQQSIETKMLQARVYEESLSKKKQDDLDRKADSSRLVLASYVDQSSKNLGMDIYAGNSQLMTFYDTDTDNYQEQFSEQDRLNWEEEQTNIKGNLAMTYIDIMGDREWYNNLSRSDKANQVAEIFKKYQDMVEDIYGDYETGTGKIQLPRFDDFVFQWKNAWDNYEIQTDESERVLLEGKMRAYFGIPDGLSVNKFNDLVEHHDDTIHEALYKDSVITSDPADDLIIDEDDDSPFKGMFTIQQGGQDE